MTAKRSNRSVMADPPRTATLVIRRAGGSVPRCAPTRTLAPRFWLPERERGGSHHRMAALVGITTYPPNAADRYELPQEYVAAVRRAGAVPVLIAPGEPRPDDLLDRLDGVVLAGGGDIDPARWGGDPIPPSSSWTRTGTTWSWPWPSGSSTTACPRSPSAGACRCVNTALGGTLHPHLPDAVTTDEPHRREPKWSHTHRVSLHPDSLVARTMGTEHRRARLLAPPGHRPAGHRPHRHRPLARRCRRGRRAGRPPLAGGGAVAPGDDRGR